MKTKPTRVAKRADYGKPVDGFFAKQPAALRMILDELRALVVEVAPTAQAAIKWGMPWFTIDGALYAGLGAHKAHVNLILPGTKFADPNQRLLGDGKTGKHLKLTSAREIPRDEVRGWLKVAAANARAK